MVAGAKVQIGLRPVQRWGGGSIEYGVSSIGRDEPRVAGGGKDREARLTIGSEAQSNNPALAFLVHRASEPPGLSRVTDLPCQLAHWSTGQLIVPSPGA